MIDLGREIASSVRIDWSATRSQAAEAGMHVRRRRRAIARAMVVATTIAGVAIGWAAWPRSETHIVAWQPPSLPEVAAVRPSSAAPAPIDHPMALVAEALGPPRGDSGASVISARGLLTPAPSKPKRPVRAYAPKFASSHYERPLDVETWLDLAKQGDYDKAYTVLGDTNVRDVPDELLLAADVKRLSHHPAEAVAPLRQLLRDHAGDPRAPLAAFTLGRVLLEQLDRPGDAAEAFGRADLLAPDGPLAEDAVARQVEALARAGDARDARIVAEQYVARFPAGRKLRSVRKLGGL